jgi:hypothetical protein
MDNHYHLLIETPEANLVAGMRRLNGVYTQGFNRRHDTVGHVFQGRYKAILVDKQSYLLELCRYVVLNPVRARMCKRVQDYPWSSYLATLSRTGRPEWLAADRVLGLFSGRSPRGAYARFVQAGVDRVSPWQDLRGQIYLGNSAFLASMQSRLPEEGIDDVPAAQCQPTRPSREQLLSSVADAFGVTVAEVCARRHLEAARAATLLLRRAANLPIRDVAATLGVSAPRVSQIQRELESRPARGVLLSLLKAYQLKN